MRTSIQRLLASTTLAFVPVLGGCSSTPDAGAGGGGAATGTLYVNGDIHGYVYAVDLASGAATKLVPGADPFPTPDGTILCKNTNTSALGEYGADGVTFRTIVEENVDAPFDQTFDDNFQNPQLSPDGKLVAYEGQLGYTFDVYVVDRATGQLVGAANPKKVGVGYVRPTWTPDGRLVVAGGPNNPGLYVSDAALTNPARFDPNLTAPDQPAVSPDGRTVAFVLNDDIFTIGLDGTGLTRVTQSNDKESWPSWSPDGSRLVFYTDTTILAVALDGSSTYDLSLHNDQFVTFDSFREGQMSWR